MKRTRRGVKRRRHIGYIERRLQVVSEESGVVGAVKSKPERDRIGRWIVNV